MMKLKYIPFLIIIFSLCPIFFFGQIKVSELIQESQIAIKNDKALYFVDFWATWCGPCIHVSKYLESLQSQFPDDLCVISLSQENPETVRKFIKKHPVKLAIAIDFNGEAFNEFNIKSLPFGILFNGKGEKLWEGHPAELNSANIKVFLKENRKRVPQNSFFNVVEYEKNIEKEVFIPISDFEIFELNSLKDENLQVTNKEGYLEVKGYLLDILSYCSNIYKDQLKVQSGLNKRYKVHFKYNTNAFIYKTEEVIKALKLECLELKNQGKAIVFNINKPSFWNTQQINWGDNAEKFLIGDSEIQADNVSLSQIAYQLASILEIPVIINSNDAYKNSLHDWQIHYKYFELMVSSLKDNYGIDAEKKYVDYPQYIVTKKTP